jgi:L-threonylcarbamoyladenylate synthase
MPQVTSATLIAAVRAGRALIGFPTDTVPALATQPAAAELIYAAKQRQADKPLILMAAEPADLWDYVQPDSQAFPLWQQVAKRYWPGALTLVLPASDKLPTSMNPRQTGTIGLRIPNWPAARYLLQQTGALATTSINQSGQPALIDWKEVHQQFAQVLIPIQSAWVLPQQAEPLPSTVVKWTGTSWEMLRQGGVRFEG